jgi:hypothetical protein
MESSFGKRCFTLGIPWLSAEACFVSTLSVGRMQKYDTTQG